MRQMVMLLGGAASFGTLLPPLPPLTLPHIPLPARILLMLRHHPDLHRRRRTGLGTKGVKKTEGEEIVVWETRS
jgi:hypothetical protein